MSKKRWISWILDNGWKISLVLSFNAERVILSRVDRSHSAQVVPYILSHQNWLLFADTQSTSGIFLHGHGEDEWHTTTKSEMTAGAGNQMRISRKQVSALDHQPIFFTPEISLGHVTIGQEYCNTRVLQWQWYRVINPQNEIWSVRGLNITKELELLDITYM